MKNQPKIQSNIPRQIEEKRKDLEQKYGSKFVNDFFENMLRVMSSGYRKNLEKIPS